MTLVHVDIADRVATLTLDDPERRNALTLPMVDDIVAAMDQIEADEGVGAIVVTGAPPAFCAGADLGNLGGTGDGPGFRTIYEGFLRVARSPLPTIAAVNGAAVGAGHEHGARLRRAHRGARGRSSTPASSRSACIPAAATRGCCAGPSARQAAAAAVLFGEVLDGAAAERVGLAYRCVDDADLAEAAHALAAKAADGRARARHHREGDARRDGNDRRHTTRPSSRELTPQVWSTQQPWFRRAARRASGEDREELRALIRSTR